MGSNLLSNEMPSDVLNPKILLSLAMVSVLMVEVFLDMPQVSAESKVKIPDWIKKVVEFWISDQIDDDGFMQVIEYLIEKEIIVVPYSESPEDNAKQDIPVWIKTNSEFWIEEKISDDEFSAGVEWLINNGIIKVSSDDADSEGRTIKIEVVDGIGTGDR